MHFIYQRCSTNGFFVRSGTSQYYKGGAIHQVEQVKIHPDYKQISNDCDLALIKVRGGILYTQQKKKRYTCFIFCKNMMYTVS